MYSKEEIQIMNLDDNYTLLYPFLVKKSHRAFWGAGRENSQGGNQEVWKGQSGNAPQQTLERRSQDQYAQPVCSRSGSSSRSPV